MFGPTKFHPGFFLTLDQPEAGPITDYARIEDFSTGEVSVQWRAAAGSFKRRMFVSKVSNVIAFTETGPKGKLSLDLAMQPVGNDLIDSHIETTGGMIICHNVYVKGKGGYDGAVRVIASGGTVSTANGVISVKGADSVTAYMRIQPWKTPLEGSQAWPYSSDNPDFKHPAEWAGPYRAAPEYNPQWMTQLENALNGMPSSYDAVFAPHRKAWGSIYGRVSIDLGGLPTERAMSSEALLDLAQQEKRLPPALLERMWDAGRYVFLCSAGPETQPNLFGIWTGTWQPAWSGDYTTDTNVQLDIECAYSCNMADCMNGYFNMWDSYIPDFQRNAHGLYGCRGILTGSRASNNGLALHWDSGWPGNLWTPGASWLAHWYYDYYQYTGDKKFLRERAIPWMEQCALFWEDFLKGTEDSSGHYMFRPSYSAENGWGDNSSQDIEITHELLTNLITGCETLGIDSDKVVKWKAMLAKMPPLLINDQGQLKEWSNPTQGENNNHRHLMHLYGAFESGQFSDESDPKLFAAAKVALMNRIKALTEDATHGYMHTGLAAAGLGLGDVAFQRIEELAIHRSIYPSMVDAHYGGPRVLCDDGNGATPEIVNRMIVQSKIGELTLLPALPIQLPHGTLCGTRARGAITVNRIDWNRPDGTLVADITSDATQEIAIRLAPGSVVEEITIDGKARPVAKDSTGTAVCHLTLPKGRKIELRAKVKFADPVA